MSRNLMVLFLFVAAVCATAIGSPSANPPPPKLHHPIITPKPHHPMKCGKNQVYEKCGSACPPSCKNLNIKFVCPKKCVQGCFCEKGLVKNALGVCVRPCECDCPIKK